MDEDQQGSVDLRGLLAAERRKFQRFVEVATALSSTLNVQELLQLIMSSGSDLLGAERSSLLLVDEQTGELVFQVVGGDRDGDVAQRRVPPGLGIAGWALDNRQPVVVDEPASDKRFYADIGEAVGVETRNLLATPLMVKDKAIGVVEIMNKIGGSGFSASDVELASALAGMAAIALENATMYARLADALVSARLSYRL